MAKQGASRMQEAQAAAARTAEAQGVELVELTLQKEADGMALCIYIDRDGGITLDDCERFHKAVQPLLDDIEYDYLEVSSPGIDRPITTGRDVEKHLGDNVEVKLYVKLDGVKQFTGSLTAMDADAVAITTPDGREMQFPRKSVALVRPVVQWDENEEEE